LIYRQYTDIHALWGLIGWVVLLILAVSSQVLPMFFVMPEFSVRYLKGLSLLIVSTLSVMSLFFMTGVVDSVLWHEVIKYILSLELVFFSSYTLLLINQRKRKLPDVTINFFRLSLLSLLMAIVCWWVFQWWPYAQSDLRNQFEFTQGLLLIYGLAMSAIIGMLQKIVPFLIYLNLQGLSFRHPESMSAEPKLLLNMKQIISTSQSRIQFVLHCSSFLLLLFSIFWLQLVWLAGLAMLVNFLWLNYVLFNGFIYFNKNKKQILKFPEMKMDFGI